jgi:hypothetical protein
MLVLIPEALGSSIVQHLSKNGTLESNESLILYIGAALLTKIGLNCALVHVLI